MSPKKRSGAKGPADREKPPESKKPPKRKKQPKFAKQPPPKKRSTILLGLLLVVAGIIAVSGAGLLSSRMLGGKTFEQIQAECLILNDHEHIQSINEAPRMVGAMDQLGIKRVALMGSSWFTITLNPAVGFTRYDENNEELLKICQEYPGRFEAWPTVDPHDPEKLEKFKDYMSRGATGLKLYLGHGFIIPKTNKYMFHTMAVDDPRMFPLYEYCQENFIPVDLHVNPGPTRPGFMQEFVAMLYQFPDLKVVCPHFMLSTIQYMKSKTGSSRLEQFLDTFPNLYTDTSFGHDDFLVPGLKRLSKERDRFRALFKKYPTRIFYSTDLVVTQIDFKSQQWIYDRFKAYLDMLAKDTYTTPIMPDETLRGLALPPNLLERALYKNYEDFLASRPRNTEITRRFDFSQTGVKLVDRKPGQALPPPPPKR